MCYINAWTEEIIVTRGHLGRLLWGGGTWDGCCRIDYTEGGRKGSRQGDTGVITAREVGTVWHICRESQPIQGGGPKLACWKRRWVKVGKKWQVMGDLGYQVKGNEELGWLGALCSWAHLCSWEAAMTCCSLLGAGIISYSSHICPIQSTTQRGMNECSKNGKRGRAEA